MLRVSLDGMVGMPNRETRQELAMLIGLVIAALQLSSSLGLWPKAINKSQVSTRETVDDRVPWREVLFSATLLAVGFLYLKGRAYRSTDADQQRIETLSDLAQHHQNAAVSRDAMVSLLKEQNAKLEKELAFTRQKLERCRRRSS